MHCVYVITVAQSDLD